MASEVIIVPVIFFTFYMIIKTLSNNRLRKHLADRDIKKEELEFLYGEISNSGKLSMNSFKLGLLSLILGLDLIIVDMMQLYDETAFATFLISGGFILIFADKLEKVFTNKSNEV